VSSPGTTGASGPHLPEKEARAGSGHRPSGESELLPLTSKIDGLAERLQAGGALGLILVDASPLTEIERLYGTERFRTVLAGLAQRLNNRLAREVGDAFTATSGAMAEEQILLFLHRPREDWDFYTEALPRLIGELRGYVGISLKRVAYPYLARPLQLPLGHTFAFYRPFQRPETQIRMLVEQALAASQFELERSRRERISALQRILMQGSIVSVYEPIVGLSDRVPIGYEALARGPIGTGLETPVALFAAAAEGDLTFELDVLCRRRALRGACGIDPGSKLFLNILPSSIYDPDFTELRIRRALEELGIGPANLVLEISERGAISNFQIFREAVDHISRLGVGIALDDTGSGYSSLEAAMEISPDFLKVDMTLVRGLEDDPQRQELLRSLHRLSHNMNARLIAEGVETEAEFDALVELGVELGQGFLFGRSGPIGTKDE
jgi:EAL domain-containing protein (putative c-di-GMP-specific phosphodiesterase class I)